MTHDSLGSNVRVLAAPVVKPAHPVLTYHQRYVLSELTECGERLSWVRVEIDDGEYVRQSAIRQVFCIRVVGREVEHIEACLAQHSSDCFKVDFIVAKSAVFILHLDHDDRAAASYLKRLQFSSDTFDVAAGSREEARVRGPYFHVRYCCKPGREAAPVPLSANVRPRTHDHQHALLLGCSYKLGDVQIAGEVELSGSRLVNVPEDVSGDGI